MNELVTYTAPPAEDIFSTAEKMLTIARCPKAAETCPCCHQVMPHPRNQQRHALLFAILKPALEQWPHDHPFQPIDTEHLRSWLLVEAKHCTSDEVVIGGGSKAQIVAALTAFMNRQRAKSYVHFRQTATGIKALTPKSIAFNKCAEHVFRGVLENVIEVVEAAIGVTVDQLKRERAA